MSSSEGIRLRQNLLKLNPFARQKRQAARCKLLLPTKDVSKLGQVTTELCSRDRQVAARHAKAEKDFLLVDSRDEQIVRFASDSYCEFFGFRSDEVVGQNSESLFGRQLTAFGNTTRATVITTTLFRKDGSSCVVELSVVPLMDNKQQLVMYAAVVGQVFDCSFQEQADDILRFFEAAKAMSAAIASPTPAPATSSSSSDNTTLIDPQTNKPAEE